MRKSIPALVTLVFLTLPAFADGTQAPVVAQPTATPAVAVAPAAPAQPASARPDSDKMICRTMVHEGMLVKTNTCHTQAQWDQIRTDQQHSVSEFQNRNYTMSGGGH
jgi:Spy/CpxP family protein refolding chaperone